RSVVLLRISHTAEELETETTVSSAMSVPAAATAPFGRVPGVAIRSTFRIMPAARPASLPPSMYTASSATYLILNDVLMFVGAVTASVVWALGLGVATWPAVLGR